MNVRKITIGGLALQEEGVENLTEPRRNVAPKVFLFAEGQKKENLILLYLGWQRVPAE